MSVCGCRGFLLFAAMIDKDKQFFRPSEVADLLGIDRSKVVQFIKRGELRAIDISLTRSTRPRWRISRNDLESFLARRATSPPPKSRPKLRVRKTDDVIQFYK